MKYFSLFIFILTSSLFSQSLNQNPISDSNDEYLICSDWSLDIPSSTWGLSFGNSKNFNGFRFNYRDCDVETINGFNFTIWDAFSVTNSEVNGISLGLMPHASKLHGINIGLGAVIAEEEMFGLNFGLLSAVSNGNLYGVNIGGLALVSNKEITGINFGGLALVSNGNISGINIGGLASVANGNMHGINFSLLALVSDGELFGFNFGGLASVAQSGITGINIGGLALVSGESIMGINFGGLAIVTGGKSLYGLSLTLGQIKATESINGISISGYKTEAVNFTGANFTIAWTEFYNMTGFSFAGYNRIHGNQTGLTIGIVNYAKNLNGVQLGLINIADNNSGWSRILPFINAHF